MIIKPRKLVTFTCNANKIKVESDYLILLLYEMYTNNLASFTKKR